MLKVSGGEPLQWSLSDPMATFHLVVIAQVVVGLALALILWRSEVLRGHLLVHVVGVACLVAGFILMAHLARGQGDVTVTAAEFLLAALAWVPFVIFLVFFWVGQVWAAASATNEPSVLPKTYTAMEKAEGEGNFKRAIMLYRRELERDPKDLEARRRLAEVLLRDNQMEDAIGELRLAATVTQDPDAEVDLIIRVSDILLNKKLDFDTALADLDFLRKKHQGTPAGERAQKRFQRVYILREARKERTEEAGS
jgi:tetratricopeptide (TPR) repeat protein